jgi:hypothetical protein
MAEKYIPLPDESDYETAVDISTEYFNSEGGPWTFFNRLEMQAQASQNQAFMFQHNIGRIGFLLESRNESGGADDELFRTTTAFRHGMNAGMQITDLAHNGLIRPVGALKFIAVYVGLDKVDDEEPDDLNRMSGLLIDISERGLARMGDASVEKIIPWEDDVVSYERFRRVFRFGIGATVFAFSEIHKQHNEEAMNRLEESFFPPNSVDSPE